MAQTDPLIEALTRIADRLEGIEKVQREIRETERTILAGQKLMARQLERHDEWLKDLHKRAIFERAEVPRFALAAAGGNHESG